MQSSLDNIAIKSRGDLHTIGQSSVDTMQSEIRSSISREGSTGTLEKSVKSYIFELGKMIVVGIGKLSEMPIYTMAQNFGSAHLVGKKVPGYFGENERPVSGGSGQKFTYKRKSFLMTPKKPIAAKNYIERCVTRMRSIIPTLFGRK